MKTKTKVPTAAKGARSMASVDPHYKDQLNQGLVATRSLTEGLSVDMEFLLRTLAPEISRPNLAGLGVVVRMQRCGEALAQNCSSAQLLSWQSHPSDTVRGWLCYASALRDDLSLQEHLSAIECFADDPHFGVREWAWLALRPRLLENLSNALEWLLPWTQSASENVRRFASEATRPRGVWCTHSAELRRKPEIAALLLDALKADPSRYVQNSVANWLNDAAKDNPSWVRDLCAGWLAENPTSAATSYICKRAQRSLR